MKIACTLIPLIIASSLMCQPDVLNFQAMALDRDGNPLNNAPIEIEIRLIEDQPDGPIIFVERQQVTTSDRAIFSLQIGAGNNQTGSLADALWSEEAYWIAIYMDANGSGELAHISTQQLVAVPYAFHARTATLVDDADADPENEIQDLMINVIGNNVELLPSHGGNGVGFSLDDGDANPINELQSLFAIKNGDSVDLNLTQAGTTTFDVRDGDFDATNEYQSISASRNGALVDLTLTDGGTATFDVRDGDADNLNEIQSLALLEKELSISQGNSVDLRPIATPWTESAHGIFYNGGNVRVEDPALTNESTLYPDSLVISARSLRSHLNSEHLVFDEGISAHGLAIGRDGIIKTDPNSPVPVYRLDDRELKFFEGNGGFFSSDSSGFSDPYGFKLYSDAVRTSHSYGQASTQLIASQLAFFNDIHGAASIGNDESTGSGYLDLFGPRTRNILIGGASHNSDHGSIEVYDHQGVPRAGLFVDPNGDGRIFSDIKHFRMEHPENSEKEIWYASLEGPEAGAYCRGTDTLMGGEAFIPYPDHFVQVSDAGNMTIQLTPHSAKTYGLAVVSKTDKGFYVKELMGGKGHFAFDWEAKSSRRGFEDYEVVRSK